MTITEIAKLCGVSKSTVSRVLNNSEHVNPKTKEKVLRVIQENNYEPSLIAQSLSKNTNTTIGVVIPEIDNEFFGEVLAGINEVVDAQNLTMICCDTNNNPNRERKAIRTLSQQRVCGIIITPSREDLPDLRIQLQNVDVPVVILDRHIQSYQFDSVHFDNFGGAYAATQVLIDEGYSRIAVITGDLSLQIGRERFDGYKVALQDADIEVDEQFIYYGDFSIETAYRIASEIFQSSRLPDAILTSNNRTTIGLIKAAREHNIRLGRDLALIGIDRVTLLDALGYPFSCITRDSRAMGRDAVHLLLKRIENADQKNRQINIAPYHIQLKGSEKRTTDFFGAMSL